MGLQQHPLLWHSRAGGGVVHSIKSEGRYRTCIHDYAMGTELSNRKLLEADLRGAIENNRLRLLYQPIFNKSGEEVIGV